MWKRYSSGIHLGMHCTVHRIVIDMFTASVWRMYIATPQTLVRCDLCTVCSSWAGLSMKLCALFISSGLTDTLYACDSSSRSKHTFYLGKYDSGTKQKKVKGRPTLCCGCGQPICKKQSGVIPCLEIDGGHDRCQEACLNYKISQLWSTIILMVIY